LLSLENSSLDPWNFPPSPSTFIHT
jgi:hypothetical protein